MVIIIIHISKTLIDMKIDDGNNKCNYVCQYCCQFKTSEWTSGGRDSELTCVCSRTSVSNGPGDSYPAAERLANVSVRRQFKHSSNRIAANDIFGLCR